MVTRWGILGTGYIARAMADALQLIPEAHLAAVGSRTQARADAFGGDYGVPHRFDTYSAVCECSDVDVVYVATPHVFHARDTMMALRARKAVLCEKPFTMDASEATEVIDLARLRGLFLMEAMWTRFVPAIVTLQKWIADGAIGSICSVRATLGWEMPYDPASRLFDPALGGGALLDLGVYPLSYFTMLLGEPLEVRSVKVSAPSGVDLQCAGALGYEKGTLATFVASLEANLPNEALLVGTKGSLRVHPPLVAPQALTRTTSNAEPETYKFPVSGNGYVYEAREVMRCLARGELESSIMPLDETLAVMRITDEIRDEWT